jgi:hypothetical protein
MEIKTTDDIVIEQIQDQEGYKNIKWVKVDDIIKRLACLVDTKYFNNEELNYLIVELRGLQ